ncbi:MAG: hypothetical protein V1690_03140 [Candidatus Moraniibacteriota bacterium]
MGEIKTNELAIARVWVNIKSRAIVETSIATVVAVIVPALLAHTPQNQFIVGPIVNAVLFWVALRVGITNALFIAVIPSLIALFRGMLPPTAAMFIPFIILGNCAMILAFSLIKSKLWLRVAASSVLKTLVIFLPTWLLLNLSSPVSFMMSWPQLVTAIVGGLIVVIINKKLNTTIHTS